MSNEAKIVTVSGIAIIALFGALVYVAQKQSGGSTPSTGGAISQDILVRPNSHGTATIPTRVTVTEFGDYQCPACAAAEPAVKELIKKYEGKVSFVFRHFPLDIHENAKAAASAAEAAALQGKFGEMHTLLYEKQSEWSETKNAKTLFTGYATTLGLNPDQFTKDMESENVASRIKADTKDGEAAQIRATPTFFINTTPFVGIPAKEFADALEKELTNKQ